MPQDVRRLVFTHAETTEAILQYGQEMNIAFPQGKITRAKFGGAGEYEQHHMRDFKSHLHRTYNVQEKRKTVIITFFDEKTLEHKYFNLTADFVSAALIEYCIKHKVVLPKDAVKTLDITDFNVCLDIHFENYSSPDVAPIMLE